MSAGNRSSMNSASSGNGSKLRTQRSKENRRKLVSLQITFAPIARGQIARLPVPADGSKTISVGFGSSSLSAKQRESPQARLVTDNLCPNRARPDREAPGSG